MTWRQTRARREDAGRAVHSPERLSARIVGVDTTDKLTDPQIVAKVKEHYGLDR